MITTKAIVASGHDAVSNAAILTLKKGGNAFDAILAAGFVSAVAEPCLTSLGGGGFLLADPRGAKPILYDFFSDTPGKGLSNSALSPHFYPVTVDFSGSKQDFNVGMGSVAVPGVLHGYLKAHGELCSLPLSEIVAPAIKAAQSGVLITEQQGVFLHLLQPILCSGREGRKLYNQNGTYISAGDYFHNHDYAAFLQQLGHNPTTTFYQPPLSQHIATDMTERHGLLSLSDLSEYQTIKRPCCRGTYRDLEIFTNPPPSFGGSLILLALSELGQYDFQRITPDSPEHISRLGQMMLNVEKKRLHKQSAPPICTRGTTHISISDHLGNSAAMTTSNGEGSGYVIPGTGIMLNNMMGEDDLHPEGFHASPPGVRVASMMSPTIIKRNGETVLVIGSGGSKRIRTAIIQVLHLIFDFDLDCQRAVAFPRIHWDGTTFQVEPGFRRETVQALAKLGPVNIWPGQNVYFGGVHAVMPGHGGGGDPRRGGVVVME